MEFQECWNTFLLDASMKGEVNVPFKQVGNTLLRSGNNLLFCHQALLTNRPFWRSSGGLGIDCPEDQLEWLTEALWGGMWCSCSVQCLDYLVSEYLGLAIILLFRFCLNWGIGGVWGDVVELCILVLGKLPWNSLKCSQGVGLMLIGCGGKMCIRCGNCIFATTLPFSCFHRLTFEKREINSRICWNKKKLQS